MLFRVAKFPVVSLLVWTLRELSSVAAVRVYSLPVSSPDVPLMM